MAMDQELRGKIATTLGADKELAELSTADLKLFLMHEMPTAARALFFSGWGMGFSAALAYKKDRPAPTAEEIKKTLEALAAADGETVKDFEEQNFISKPKQPEGGMYG